MERPKGTEAGSGQKVLVVEDEPSLVDTLEYSLTRQGYEVRTATDGAKALELARKEQPDLVVLDVMLPSLDGFEVCRILRQEMSVPILMLTARTDEVDKIVGLEVGADDYMTKPFSMRELTARVRRCCAASGLSAKRWWAKKRATGRVRRRPSGWCSTT